MFSECSVESDVQIHAFVNHRDVRRYVQPLLHVFDAAYTLISRLPAQVEVYIVYGYFVTTDTPRQVVFGDAPETFTIPFVTLERCEIVFCIRQNGSAIKPGRVAINLLCSVNMSLNDTGEA